MLFMRYLKVRITDVFPEMKPDLWIIAALKFQRFQ